MNYYRDTTDYIEGYNPIISDTRIPDRYNPDNDILDDCINCLMGSGKTDVQILANCPCFDECPFKVIWSIK